MKKRIFDLTGIVLILGTWVLCWLFVMQYGVFGSKVDWISQHSVIPDYFRQRFYATGDLFPDIAWNLGGGQNIYNFSYYGLFSPVILLSYLLPFVEMDHYVHQHTFFFSLLLSFLPMAEKKSFRPGSVKGSSRFIYPGDTTFVSLL